MTKIRVYINGYHSSASASKNGCHSSESASIKEYHSSASASIKGYHSSASASINGCHSSASACVQCSLTLSLYLSLSYSLSLRAQVHNELWRRGLILCDPEKGEERCDMIRLVLAKERSVELDDVPVIEVTIS